MCILVVALHCHPSFPFICAHNRDEYRSRPSGQERLEPDTQIICGRDLLAGGIVMGLHSERGHFAVLTNVRTHHKRDPATRTSRGSLVEHIVAHGPESAEGFVAANKLDGFHLVYGNIFGKEPQLRYSWCCPQEDPQGRLVAWSENAQDMKQGVFVISNENILESSVWPKTEWLRGQVAEFLRSLPHSPVPETETVHAALEEIMGRFDIEHLQPPKKLPRWFPESKERRLHTGAFAPWTRDFPEFGTVSQRIVVNKTCNENGSLDIRYYHRCTNVGASEDAPPRCAPWVCWSIVLPEQGLAGESTRCRETQLGSTARALSRL